MKSVLSSIFLFLLLIVSSCAETNKWELAIKIESDIKKTSFPEIYFNIIDFGATEGNPLFLNTSAINDAIKKCNSNGGGVVLIPKGTWYTGPIQLKSNVNLHIDEEAVLKFSTDYNNYLPAVLTRWEGIDCFNFHPLIYAFQESNIAITGKGIIDGQASNANWWWMNGNPNYGWNEGMNSQKKTGRPRLLSCEQEKVSIEKRIFGVNDALRPQLINFYQCNTVLIEGLKIKNSPFWVIHPVLTDNFILRGVNIESYGPNSDGCDPEYCNNVLIENCYFNTGDDCIAIKSGRNNEGRKWNVPSRNIIIRNCKMAAGHGGVVIGSEISGGFSNLFVENCEMNSPELLRVIRIKTSTCRGGIIENINVRNIKVGQCVEAVLNINLKYEPDENCDRRFPPIIKDITLENVTSEKSQYGLLIIGLDESVNVSEIKVINSSFNGVTKGNSIRGAKRIKFKKLLINNIPINS